MSGLTLRAQVYVASVGLLGPLALLASWLALPVQVAEADLWNALLLGVLSLVTENVIIAMPKGGLLTASTIPQIAALFILPLPAALSVTAFAAGMADLLARKIWYKILFNTGQLVLSLGCAGLVLHTLGGAQELLRPGHGWQAAAVVLVALLAYYFTNNVLIDVIVALDRRTSLLSVWLANVRGTFLLEIGQTVLGVLVAYLWRVDAVWVVLGIVPAIMSCKAFNYISELEEATRESIITLADSIDQRDRYTYHHSERVARYAEMIATRMKLNPRHVRLIATAARVHDLGKMGVADSVLFKPGSLSASERRHMNRHPEVGAEILRRYRLFRDGVECVLHHHERYDGTGYPAGLRGEQIPLSARILAVADAYEAMTADRPYRKALSKAEAAAELKAGMATQFDPVVVGVFLTILEAEVPALQVLPSSDEALKSAAADGGHPSSASASG